MNITERCKEIQREEHVLVAGFTKLSKEEPVSPMSIAEILYNHPDISISDVYYLADRLRVEAVYKNQNYTIEIKPEVYRINSLLRKEGK